MNFDQGGLWTWAFWIFLCISMLSDFLYTSFFFFFRWWSWKVRELVGQHGQLSGTSHHLKPQRSQRADGLCKHMVLWTPPPGTQQGTSCCGMSFTLIHLPHLIWHLTWLYFYSHYGKMSTSFLMMLSDDPHAVNVFSNQILCQNNGYNFMVLWS